MSEARADHVSDHEAIEAALFAAEDVRAGYSKEVDVLRGVDLMLQEGEMVSIIGPNGAGKSTLVKAMFGLVDVREGRVLLKGEDVTGLKAHSLVARGVGYVPQTSNVFPRLSIEENLEMGAYLHADTLDERLDLLFDWFPLLDERRKQRAGTLSGGQRQLVAVARALMANPDVLLLDEPSAGLSPGNVDQIFERIEEINERGISILIVEQNARRALAMADRGYVLEQGANRFTGKGVELLHDPKVAELYLGGAG